MQNRSSEIHVYEVKEKGAAEEAGIKLGDRILAVSEFRADRSVYDLMTWDFKVISNVPFLELKVQTDEEAPRVIHLEAKKKVEPVVLDFTGQRGDIWDLIREMGRGPTPLAHPGVQGWDWLCPDSVIHPRRWRFFCRPDRQGRDETCRRPRPPQQRRRF